MSDTNQYQQELSRLRRVSDQMCTAHASLHDRFWRRALVLDILVLGLTAGLVALGFGEEKLLVRLTPEGLTGREWMGLLGAGAFLVALVQWRTDWKGRADGHKRSLDMYAAIKREIGYAIMEREFDDRTARRIFADYDIISTSSVKVPEADFLRQKARHTRKIQISKHLDSNPSASIMFARIRFWWSDNFQKAHD